MKVIFFLFLSLTSLTLLAQDATSFKISEGFASNSQTGAYHALMINLNGDIDQFISLLQKDFGKKCTYTLNDDINRILLFNNILIEELGEEKIKFNLSSISNGNRHIITITCSGKKKKDFLRKGTESHPVIKKYLESVLQKL